VLFFEKMNIINILCPPLFAGGIIIGEVYVYRADFMSWGFEDCPA